jgi:hypothetical protein
MGEEVQLLHPDRGGGMSRPTFMAITSTGGYIRRWFWNNSSVHNNQSLTY